MGRALKYLMFLLLVVLAFMAIYFFQSQKRFAQRLEDVRITASVKTAFALNRHLKDLPIEVSTDYGQLSLKGRVETEVQRELALEIASSIKGVKGVKEELTFFEGERPAPPEQTPERSLGEKIDDLTLSASVRTALSLYENLPTKDIKVKTFRSTVTLEGFIYSEAQKELAEKVARDVEGVVKVDNNLAIQAPGQGEGKEGARPWRERLDDTWIEAQVKSSLLLNRNIEGLKIDVEVKEGVVTLKGQVPTGAHRDLAEKIAEGVKGVKEVKNLLEVVP